MQGAKLAFLPSQYGVKLRVSVEGDDEKELKNKLLEVEQRIRGKAGRFIYGTGEDQLEAVVGRLLLEREFKIATAESVLVDFLEICSQMSVAAVNILNAVLFATAMPLKLKY